MEKKNGDKKGKQTMFKDDNYDKADEDLIKLALGRVDHTQEADAKKRSAMDKGKAAAVENVQDHNPPLDLSLVPNYGHRNDHDQESNEASTNQPTNATKRKHENMDLGMVKRRGEIGKVHKCDCGSEFKSYQALGGHLRHCDPLKNQLRAQKKEEEEKKKKEKIYECHVCGKIFTRGCVLGVHKKSHKNV